MGRTLDVTIAATRILNARLFNKYAWHQEIVNQCESLGGVYIKFIQMLAVHESTKHWVKDVSTDLAYEQVAYEPINVTAEIGHSAQYFRSIDSRPFAAGSYGQVYRAELVSGEQVIIKILRPSVRRTLRQDLRILNGVARVLSWWSKSSIVDLRAITQEFSQSTFSETNYVREAQSGEWLREYFTKRRGLYIPKSYKEYGSETVLVQQYVHGISLASAMSKQREGKKIDQVVYDATGSNVWQQLTTLGNEFLEATLYADFQMVDPHPGNIRFMSENRVALIDFGMMSKAPRNRAAFVNMIGEYVKVYENRFEPGPFAIAMLAFFDMELHDALQLVARQRSSDYMESLEEFIQEYARSQANDSLTQHYVIERQMARLFNQVINKGNKLGIRISKENIMLQRSMNMFLSLMRQIGEAHDGQVHFALLHQVISAAHTNAIKNGFEQQVLPEMTEEHAYEVTANWLTIVAEKDRELYGFIMKRRFA